LALSIVLLKHKLYGTQNWLARSHFDSFRGLKHSFPCETKEGKSKFKFLIPYHLLSGTCFFDFCLFQLQPLAFNIFFRVQGRALALSFTIGDLEAATATAQASRYSLLASSKLVDSGRGPKWLVALEFARRGLGRADVCYHREAVGQPTN